jgi:hypothetical protein
MSEMLMDSMTGSKHLNSIKYFNATVTIRAALKSAASKSNLRKAAIGISTMIYNALMKVVRRLMTILSR